MTQEQYDNLIDIVGKLVELTDVLISVGIRGEIEPVLEKPGQEEHFIL